MFKGNSLGDLVASEMESIMSSKEHKALHAKPEVSFSKTAAKKKKEEDCDEDEKKDKKDKKKEEKEEKDEKKASLDSAIKGVEKISEILDDLGFEKSAMSALRTLGTIVAEAQDINDAKGKMPPWLQKGKKDDDKDEDEDKDKKDDEDEDKDKKDKKDKKDEGDKNDLSLGAPVPQPEPIPSGGVETGAEEVPERELEEPNVKPVAPEANTEVTKMPLRPMNAEDGEDGEEMDLEALLAEVLGDADLDEPERDPKEEITFPEGVENEEMEFAAVDGLVPLDELVITPNPSTNLLDGLSQPVAKGPTPGESTAPPPSGYEPPLKGLPTDSPEADEV